MNLENDRGIFGTSLVKRIIEKLIYNEKYEDIDMGMSDSNIGGRKKKNIKNHLFIIYGIINSVLRGGEDPVDVGIYDIEQCFDALWLEDTMNDLVATIPSSSQDDKIAMIYEANRHNKVAINTAVGQSKGWKFPVLLCNVGHGAQSNVQIL